MRPRRSPATAEAPLEAALRRALARGDPALGAAWAEDPEGVWLAAIRLWLRALPPVLPADATSDLPAAPALRALLPHAPGLGAPPPGTTYEALAALLPGFDPALAARHRRGRGLFYTPPALAERLARVTLGPDPRPDVSVLDPACGDGALLRAAGAVLVEAGAPAERVVDQLWGVDLDPTAVEAARRAVLATFGAWSPRVRWGDALLGAPVDVGAGALLPDAADDAWCARFIGDVAGRGIVHARQAFAPVGVGTADGGFDVVLANPPFLTQLGATTALGRAEAALLKAALPGVVGAYTDVAALFAARAWDWLRPGGRMGLVLPEAVLAARDGAGLRALLARDGALVDLWLAREPVFPDTSVRVCTVVVEKRARPRLHVTRARGLPALPAPPAELDAADLTDGRSWSPLLAALRDLPPLPALPGAPLGSRATVSADFRDEYYGLVGRVREEGALGPDAPRLLVTRMVGVGHDDWGRVSVRFGKQAFLRPRVDLDALDPAIRAWAARRSVPKLVLATQTRVLEATLDRAGDLLPVTPLLTVTAPPDELPALLAALLSPVATLWALTEHGGVGLADDTIKLSAAQLRALPLPTRPEPWARAAELLDAARGEPTSVRAALPAVARLMVEAYDADPALVAWWLSRLPPA